MWVALGSDSLKMLYSWAGLILRTDFTFSRRRVFDRETPGVFELERGSATAHAEILKKNARRPSYGAQDSFPANVRPSDGT